MNEASSKYVDQIAVEKLIGEKLRHVHHLPGSLDRCDEDREWNALSGVIPAVASRGDSEISFMSGLPSGDPENDCVKVLVRPAAKQVAEVVFVHGLFEDNLKIYDTLLCELVRRGLGVYFMMLPYHYDRAPEQSRFSGEYFWSGDLLRSIRAYHQALQDLHDLHQYLRRRSGRPVGIVGFSMGGGVALTLAARAPLESVFAINPVCNMGDLIWKSPLFATILQDLQAGGVGYDDLRRRLAHLDPLFAGEFRTGRDRVVLGRSLFDQINEPGHYDLLAAKWHPARVRSYRAGHLNVLRAPRLAADIAESCLGVPA
jgi:pimeloyl-ACP methyl ester carboxylesterase